MNTWQPQPPIWTVPFLSHIYKDGVLLLWLGSCAQCVQQQYAIQSLSLSFSYAEHRKSTIHTRGLKLRKWTEQFHDDWANGKKLNEKKKKKKEEEE